MSKEYQYDPEYQSTILRHIPSYCKKNNNIYCGLGYYWNENRQILQEKDEYGRNIEKLTSSGKTAVKSKKRNAKTFWGLLILNFIITIPFELLQWMTVFSAGFSLLISLICIGFNLLLFGKLNTLLGLTELIGPLSWYFGQIYGIPTPIWTYSISVYIPMNLIILIANTVLVIIALYQQKPIKAEEAYKKGFGSISEEKIAEIIPYNIITKLADRTILDQFS